MERTIKIKGLNAQYVEVRSGRTADDGRRIVLEGDNACYREMAGVAAVEEQTVVAEVAEAAEVRALPECLATAVARVYWQRLREAGFVDESGQLLSTTTRVQAWYIAELFAEKLDVKSVKWKLFQGFWNVKNLAQYKVRSQDSGKLPPRHKEIDKVFED